jgi:hypothetical protein
MARRPIARSRGSKATARSIRLSRVSDIHLCLTVLVDVLPRCRPGCDVDSATSLCYCYEHICYMPGAASTLMGITSSHAMTKGSCRYGNTDNL